MRSIPLLALLAASCAPQAGPAGRAPDAGGNTTTAPRDGGRGGTAGTAGATTTGGTAGTGGIGGTGGTGGTGGSAPDTGTVNPVPRDAVIADPGSPDAQADLSTSTDADNSGQGPVAEGRIVFSQDFEAGMDGITRSPTNLPADRAQIADDPLGQRGKVMKVHYQAGDSFQTNGGSTHTRSWISNTGYSFPVGSTVHFAWGYMTTSRQIDAAFAQYIRPGGPMWLIEGNGDGTTYVNCRSCGGKADLPVTSSPTAGTTSASR